MRLDCILYSFSRLYFLWNLPLILLSGNYFDMHLKQKQFQGCEWIRLAHGLQLLFLLNAVLRLLKVLVMLFDVLLLTELLHSEAL